MTKQATSHLINPPLKTRLNPIMVSLTKKQTVDPLHGRFRALEPPPTQPTSESPPRSVSPALNNEGTAARLSGTPLSTQTNQVVRYVPPQVRETRSQQDRLARADAGDLQARLELISLESAEAALARRRCKHQPERSILSYLQDPGDGLAKYQAASSILEQLVDKTEETAFDSVLVFRYIKAYELWKDHPSPEIRSAEDLVKQLDSSDYVQANIVLGTSAQAAKRNYLRVIESSWGAGWFEKIPAAIKDPLWSQAEECSKRTLVQIAANAKQGISIEKAVESWTEAIHKRNNPATRREQGSKSRVTPFVMPNDVALLNQVAGNAQKGRRTCEIFLPEDVKEDRLRVDVVSLLSSPRSVPAKPDYSVGSKPRKSQKRKKPQVDGEVSRAEDDTEAEDEDEDGWKRVGKRSMVKRVRGHLIRKPIDDPVDLASETDRNNTSTQLAGRASVERRAVSSPSQPPSAQAVSTQHRSQTSKTDQRLPTCDGPAVALMFRKFVDFFDEMPSLDNNACAESRCCDNCRPLVTEKSAYLRRELVQWAAELERVQKHTSQNEVVFPSQDHDISPSKGQSLLVQSQTPLAIHDSGSDGPEI